VKTRNRKHIREVAVSQFKAKCLALLTEVSKTHTPLRVTRRGQPIADVVPPSAEEHGNSWIGSMSGRMEILGDVVSPVIDPRTIEALND